MLISGTHVGSRVWRDSHDDRSRGIAVVCPVRTRTLQEPSERLQPAAERAPARVRALVVGRCRRFGGVPAGSQPAGEGQGETAVWSLRTRTHEACIISAKCGCVLVARNGGSSGKAAWGSGRKMWSLKRSSTVQELWLFGARAVVPKPLMCTRPSLSTAQCSRWVTKCCFQTENTTLKRDYHHFKLLFLWSLKYIWSHLHTLDVFLFCLQALWCNFAVPQNKKDGIRI